MRGIPIFLVLMIALSFTLPGQTASLTPPDANASRLINGFNRQTMQPTLDGATKNALAEDLRNRLEALLAQSADDPQKTRAILTSIKDAKADLPLTDEVRIALEDARKRATDIRNRQDKDAVARIVAANPGNPDAVAKAVAGLITGSDDPARTSVAIANLASTPRYANDRSAIGTGIGQAIANLGLMEPEVAQEVAGAVQQFNDPALQSAIAKADEGPTGGHPPEAPTNTTQPQDSTPETPASAT